MPLNSIEKIEKYHAENPHIYNMFIKFTMSALYKGHKYIGAKMIIERIRWESLIEANNDKFKINNNMAPFYSRLFMKQYPMYKDIFRLREAMADAIL